jgi:hypothetical protein
MVGVATGRGMTGTVVDAAVGVAGGRVAVGGRGDGTLVGDGGAGLGDGCGVGVEGPVQALKVTTRATTTPSAGH